MIVSRYVPKGGINYILGSVDINGISRPSKILRGDLNAVLDALAFADKKKYKNPFIVATFRDPTSLKELGGMKFLEKLMDDIEEVRFPRLKKNQFAYFFALHENVDGSTELNLFVVNVANERQFSSYVDSRDFASDRIFSEVIHEKYPKLVNPNAVENRRILSPNPRWNEHQVELFKEVKASVTTLCRDKDFVKNYSKNLLKTSLTENSFTLEEDSASRLFAKNDNAKILLRGNLLKADFNLAKYLSGTESPRKYKLSAAERLEISNDKRSEILLKKYNHLEEESKYERNIRINTRINGEGRGAPSTELEGDNLGDSEGRSSEATSGFKAQSDDKGRDRSPDERSIWEFEKSRISNNSNDSEASGALVIEDNEEEIEASFMENLFLGITNSLEPWLEELRRKRKLEEAKAKALAEAKRVVEAKSEDKARFDAKVEAAQKQNRQNDASINLVGENMKHLKALKGNVSNAELPLLQNIAIFYAASSVSVAAAFKDKGFNDIYSDYRTNLKNKSHNNNNQGYDR